MGLAASEVADHPFTLYPLTCSLPLDTTRGPRFLLPSARSFAGRNPQGRAKGGAWIEGIRARSAVTAILGHRLSVSPGRGVGR